MKRTAIALVALSGALTGPVQAAGEIGAFRHTVIEKFNADDLALMKG